ncbi:hypothetical protein CFK39_03725 [Brachybacterium avium]|uniref:Uncharacterized protein n=1 Tax=Brachybacterium avium TaxID=2017485 RepID=A0A220UBM0_9MICO|nr:hypothetical protein [Brachybacterium avium]ASK65083.1 hypothetical protein CFK39_03725 [Brachybacterium avium]
MSNVHADNTDDTAPAPTGEAGVRRRQQERRSRVFVRFAIIEGVVLAAAVLAIFVLELIDPTIGIWVILVLAVLGSVILSGYLVTAARRDQRELEAARQS